MENPLDIDATTSTLRHVKMVFLATLIFGLLASGKLWLG
jgi:hypothetical protein